MAQVSISKALMLVLVIVVSLAATTVSAQDSQLAPAPAPMDAGAAFSLPISGALLMSSILFSLLALLKIWIFWTKEAFWMHRSWFLWCYREVRFDCIHFIFSIYIYIYIWDCIRLILSSFIITHIILFGLLRIYCYYFCIIHTSCPLCVSFILFLKEKKNPKCQLYGKIILPFQTDIALNSQKNKKD